MSHPSDIATGCKETQRILIKCLKPALFHLYTKVATIEVCDETLEWFKKKKKEGLKGELTWPLSFNISLQV